MVIGAGLACLVVFTPFAFGGVHPPSTALVAILAAGMLAAWGLETLVARRQRVVISRLPAAVWLGGGGFVGLVALQLVPLPPALLGYVSPETHAFYREALPGWPGETSFPRTADALRREPAPAARPVAILPSPEEVEREGLERFLPPNWAAGTTEGVEDAPRPALATTPTWRPLSVAPASTARGLIELMAVFAIFAVATAYTPAGGRRARWRFERRLLWTLAATATLVAAIGLLQRFTWNGRILWSFVPWEWGAPRPALPQTSGPFINRNHFAGYLAMLLPLLIAPLLAASPLDLAAGRRATRWVYGGATALVTTALLWSLSRGGWIAAALGTASALAVFARNDPTAARRLVLRPRRWLAAGMAAGVALLAMVLLPTSGTLGSDIDVRLADTLDRPASQLGRLDTWRDTGPMLADHPVAGVGFAAWGHAFPRYDTSPRGRTRPHRAHNDYVQLAGETGLLGLVSLGAALAAIGLRLASRGSAPRRGVLETAAVGSATALGIHAGVDFGLQIPAIAVTAAIWIGLALRDRWPRVEISGGLARALAIAAIGIAIASSAAMLRVLREPPRLAQNPALRLAAAREAPTALEPRLELGRALLERDPVAAAEVLRSAVAIDRQAAAPRDTLAAALARMGRNEQALRAIEESIARAPLREAHAYLDERSVGWLSPAEVAAVERGFRRAIASVGPYAARVLAGVHHDRQDWSAAAEAWQVVAEHAEGPRERSEALHRAGRDRARSGDPEAAQTLLEDAIALEPGSAAAYATLLAAVLGPQREIEAAQTWARRAVEAGAAPHEIHLALADAARAAGDDDLERLSLRQAFEARPQDPRAPCRLGRSHARAGEWSRAAAELRKCVEADPTHAASWHRLGRAEEELYHFARARRAFEAAVREDPAEARYRESLARFLKRLEQRP